MQTKIVSNFFQLFITLNLKHIGITEINNSIE